MEELDHFFENVIGPENVPFASKNSDENRRWDLHHYNLGTSVACIRYGAKFMQEGETLLMVTGRQRHFHSGAVSLREALLKCEDLGNVRLSKPRDINLLGCLLVEKMPCKLS